MVQSADLSRRSAMLEAIAFAANRILLTPDWQAGLPDLLQQLAIAIGADRMVLTCLHGMTGSSRLPPLAGWERPGLAVPGVAMAAWPAGLFWPGEDVEHTDLTALRVIDSDALPNGALRHWLQGRRVRSLSVLPVIVEGRRWGVLLIEDCQILRHLSDDDRDMLAVATGLIASAETRYRTTHRLRQRESQLKLVLEGVADAVITVNDRGLIEHWNPAAERIFGYSAAEAVGRTIGWLMTMTLPPQSGDPGHIIGRRRNGSTFPMEWKIDEIGDHPDHSLSIATVRDLTEQQAAEEQLRQSEQVEAVGQLTGGIAHDFNNLLTVVLGSVEWLGQHLADHPKLAQRAQSAAAAARRGAELTHRLLAFSRRQVLRPVPTDVGALLGDLVSMLRRTVVETIDIQLEVPPLLWPTLVDPGQLEAALLNLALNARDSMPTGGQLLLRAENRPGGLIGDRVVIEVCDTGSGMPSDVLARAFDPFFSTKRGSGLGLSMVQGFVTQSGGTILLASQPGYGTKVQLELPRAAVS